MILHFFEETSAESVRRYAANQGARIDALHQQLHVADRALAAAAQAERDRLAEVVMRSLSFMAVLRGPEHVFELVNDRYLQLVGHRDVLQRSVREALPEPSTWALLAGGIGLLAFGSRGRSKAL